jgi:hypothetical protein
MDMRIRALSGCLAFGAAAFILTGTAAQAATTTVSQVQSAVVLSGNHPAPNTIEVVTGTATPPGHCNCQPPPTKVPTPTCTCMHTPPPTRPPVPTVVSSTPPPVPYTSPSPVPVTTSPPPPSGAPVTGGGGSVGGGGGNLPLAAGGAATAVAAGGLGLLAIRRWRRMRSPAA